MLNCVSHSVMSDSLWPQRLQSTRNPWNSPGKNTGVGRHSLLHGIFPTQDSDLGLLHCRWILYHLSHQGSTKIFIFWLHPLSMWDLSSLTRDQTHSPARECAIKTNMLFSALNLDFKESVPYLPLTLKNDTLFHLTSYRKSTKPLAPQWN